MVNGVRVFSNSEGQAFKWCRRHWWLAWHRGLTLRTESVTTAAATGTRVHEALASWYVPDGDERVDPLFTLTAAQDRDMAIHSVSAFRSTSDEENAQLLQAESELRSTFELERRMVEGYLEWVAETGVDSELEVLGAERYVEAAVEVEGVGLVKLIAKLDALVRHRVTDLLMFIDHKALRNGTPVLTPLGWQSIETLSIGDVVIAGDGTQTQVTGVYPQGEVDLFQVTFSDGTTIDCSGDHLWYAQRQGRSRFEVVNTLQLMSDLKTKKLNRNLWHIPISAIDFDESRVHELDPYIIGVWIGDGGRKTTVFASADDEIAASVAEKLNDDDLYLKTEAINEVHKAHKIKSRKHTNRFAQVLKNLQLWECYSHERFIPDEYLRSSRSNRLALLRGLMDTDGCIRTKTKQVIYITTSPQLRDDVAFLVRSLGGIAQTTNNGRGKYVSKGELHLCRTVYTVNITLSADVNPFLLSRKANLFDSKQRRHLKRLITSIKPIERDYATCISVNHLSKLYVIKDMIITHNTVGSFSIPELGLSQQMLHYHLIQRLTAPSDRRPAGALYNMLRKVKRTRASKPPYYERRAVPHNEHELEAYSAKLVGVISDVVEVERRLEAGVSHQVAAYSTPSRDCAWRCQFFKVCRMLDDGSRAEAAIDDLYEKRDPLSYYGGREKVEE